MNRIYPAPIELHDVRDTEALCWSIARERLRRWHAGLEPADWEDLVVYLVVVAWELSLTYDPARSNGSRSFSTHATQTLKARVVDWYRKRFVDTRYTAPPKMVDLGTVERDLEDYSSGHRQVLGEAAASYEEVLIRGSIGR